MNQFGKIMVSLFEGFGCTVLLFLITLILSLPLGLAISFATKSKIKPLRYPFKVIVWIIRGTPLMLQILLWEMIPFLVFGITNIQLTSFFHSTTAQLMFVYAAIALTVNYACYFSEIFRAGMESIPKGQHEAGKVLGLTKKQTFFRVILMQVVKRTLPPLSNEIITLVKDTALAEIIGVAELMVATKNAVNAYVVLYPFIIAAVMYLLFNGLLTILFSKLEKKLSYYEV